MADNLFTPPPKYNLPLSRGGDLAVEFLNDPAQNEVYVDYDPGVTVTLVIEVADDNDTWLEAEAQVSGHTAFVKVESTVTDLIEDERPWRLVVSTPTTPTTETVAANGKTKRFDG